MNINKKTHDEQNGINNTGTLLTDWLMQLPRRTHLLVDELQNYKRRKNQRIITQYLSDALIYPEAALAIL